MGSQEWPTSVAFRGSSRLDLSLTRMPRHWVFQAHVNEVKCLDICLDQWGRAHVWWGRWGRWGQWPNAGPVRSTVGNNQRSKSLACRESNYSMFKGEWHPYILFLLSIRLRKSMYFDVQNHTKCHYTALSPRNPDILAGVQEQVRMGVPND